MKDHLHEEPFRRINFGKYFATASAIDSWNKMQNQMGEIALKDLTLTDKLIKSY